MEKKQYYRTYELKEERGISMDEHKGHSVKQIEEYAIKHKYEVVFGITFILMTIFAITLNVKNWYIILTGIGAIVGTLLPVKVDKAIGKSLQFMFGMDKVLQIVFAIILFILAIFISPLMGLILGVMAGKACLIDSSKVVEKKKEPKAPKKQPGEEGK